MPTTIAITPIKFNEFFADLQKVLAEEVVRQIEAQLEADVDAWLFRDAHERRATVSRQSQARCSRCGTQNAGAFSRNGHRPRQLVTTLGVLPFWLPRVVCECGGSVRIPFSILQPYQRIWDDVLQQIDRWAHLGLSLRQMQNEIGQQVGTQIGLRKLNETVHQVTSPPRLEFTRVPPVVMLDAIWITLLKDTGETRPDALERQRPVKTGQKVCVMVALGLYPQSERWCILDWHLAEAETRDDWETLLVHLENRGLHRQRGVELFIHDGAKGLIAALDYLYPTVPHQRCLFHKLRNLWQTIQTPDTMTRQDGQTFKHAILYEVLAIFEASTMHEACQIRDTIAMRYEATQPKFVATLMRDWSETIAFFRVLQRFAEWPRTALRTTSLLERVNRMIRQLFRAAGAFHSIDGLLATVTRILEPKRLI